MRILQVHKYLYPRDGASTYLFALADLLVQHGHAVGMWGTDEHFNKSQIRMTNDQSNSKSQIQIVGPLVGHLNFDRREGLVKDLEKFGHMIWSLEAARKFEAVLEEFKPDIIHIHNIYHHLSPSILGVAQEWDVPVVASVHDYHLINSNYTLYDHGAVCERNGLRAIAHRCIKNSYLASAADVLETTVHRAIGAYKNVARFIAPTEFVKNKLVEQGMEEGKIEVVPLLVNSQSIVYSSPSRSARLQPRSGDLKRSHYILYAGRFTVEKGVYLLLDIAKKLPDIQFKIAGTGPELKNVELRIKNEELRNVEVLGFVEKEKLQQIIAGARLVVVPSLWYDLSPYAVLEGMAAGKAVVASKIGGMADLIEDGKTGFLVGDANNEYHANLRISNSGIRKFGSDSQCASIWVDMIKKIYYDEALLKKIGYAAQDYTKRAHDLEKHYEKIMEIYRAIIR